MRRSALKALIVLLLLQAATAAARTWRVEHDGSGDFTDIQAAIDASAVRDTIRIGPGQWNTFHSHHLPGWPYSVYVIAMDAVGRDLTFIGSGPDQTVLGPSPAGHSDRQYKGIMTLYSCDRVQDLCVTGIYSGIYDGYGGIELRSSLFTNCYFGLYTFSPEGAAVVGCEFRDSVRGILCLDGGNNVYVRDCTFFNCGEGIDLQGAWMGSYDIADCTFTGGRTAIQVLYGYANISNCHATGLQGGGSHTAGLYISDYAHVNFDDCSVQTTGYAMVVMSFSTVTGTNLVLDGYWGGIFSRDRSIVTIHQSHLINAFRYTVEACYYSCPDTVRLDLTNNYWGTTDIEQIEDWIFIDQAHGPNCVAVDYLPLADGPVEAERRTWSEVKVLYR